MLDKEYRQALSDKELIKKEMGSDDWLGVIKKFNFWKSKLEEDEADTSFEPYITHETWEEFRAEYLPTDEEKPRRKSGRTQSEVWIKVYEELIVRWLRDGRPKSAHAIGIELGDWAETKFRNAGLKGSTIGDELRTLESRAGRKFRDFEE